MPNKPILSKRVLEQHTLSRYERERRTRKFVVIGSIVTAIVVLLLIGAYVLDTYVLQPNRAVASVISENITVAQMQSRERLEFANLSYNYSQLGQQVQQMQQANDPSASFLIQFYQQQLQQIVSRVTVDQIAQNSIDSLINDSLIRQEAKRRGISASPDEIQTELEKSIGYYRVTLTPFPTDTPAPATPTAVPLPTTVALTATKLLTATSPLTPTAIPTPEPSATPRLQPTTITQAELQQGKDRGVQFYTSLGYSASEFERVYETNLLTKKLQDVMAKEVPTQTQHYQFDYVRFNAVETATKYAQLLASGKITFEAMITTVNAITQPESIGQGGVIDWTSKDNAASQYGDEVVAALESTPLKKASGVITSATSGGFYLLLPVGREIRALSTSDLSAAQSKAYQDWLTKARGDVNSVKRNIDPVSVMPRDLRDSITTFQTNTSGGQGAPAQPPTGQ
jgi:hypothetical protein